MPDKIKVLIADDHPVVRQGLRMFLELQSDIEVLGEASDGVSAVDLIRKLSPDVVLMDLVMPHLDGIEAIRQARAACPTTRFIALTSFNEDDKVFPAIQAGASSYLLKDVTPDNLLEAIRACYRGEARLHPDIQRKLMEQVARRSAHEPASGTVDLTSREIEIVRLIAQGLSNQQIAQRLFISEKTVKTHISNVLGKLALEDRTQVAIYAFKHGIAPGL